MSQVVDIERRLADCVGAVYEAAASNGDWLEAGERIRQLLDARRGTLFLDNRSGALRNVLAPSAPGEVAYAAHFRSLNPYAARAARDFADARLSHVGTAKVAAELVPDETFLRSEYYFDFARRYERRHMVGGMLGTSQVVPMGFFRGDEAPLLASARCACWRRCCLTSSARSSCAQGFRATMKLLPSRAGRSMRCQSAWSSSMADSR